MAFDGIITEAMARELSSQLEQGKIDKIYQPRHDEIIINVYTRSGNRRLYFTCESSSACLRIIESSPENPPQPLAFCMLLRKHLIGGRILSVEQKDSERIIEFFIETRNELGFQVTKKLIFEIMGKHSNMILADTETGKILDSIKHLTLDMNRARQILPGLTYQYPPAQDKVPYKDAISSDLSQTLSPLAAAGETGKSILSQIGGISPAVAAELARTKDRDLLMSRVREEIRQQTFVPRVYVDQEGTPREFHIMDLTEYEETCRRMDFPTLSQALSFYFENKTASNRIRQSSRDLEHQLKSLLDKAYLKKQRLSQDLMEARDSQHLRLYGELLTANIHNMTSGMKEVTVTNYYDGSQLTIPLDPRYSPNKNAQQYFKKYSKARTAIGEKEAQLEQNQQNIDYLESVQAMLENAESTSAIESLRRELEDTGFLRRKKGNKGNRKDPRPSFMKYETSDGFQVLVGRNNKENDHLTLKRAARTDYWLHTKDIPGSHVIILTEGRELSETAVMEAASIAAYHSKARSSDNVPVDYVQVKHVKKPAGAKPGMVIFTHNRTVYVTPKVPDGSDKQ